MEEKSSYLSLVVVIFAIFIAAGVFSMTAVRAFLYAPGEAEAGPPTVSFIKQAEAIQERSLHEASLPSRLVIPVIELDAAIEHVGLGESGRMAVPVAYADVGWYRYGPSPGSVGSAVIAGHVDNGVGLPGVFRDLSELRAGDDVIVRAVDGSVRRFVVTAVEIYDKDDVPLDDLFYNDDGQKLNLITCVGEWFGSKWMYERRVVVYTELIDEDQS